MNAELIRAFFGWCTLINMAFLMLSFVLTVALQNVIYKHHGRWFAMSRETFNVVIYSYIGVYKILIIAFNLVPYIALCILT